jgi:hypothetical protein
MHNDSYMQVRDAQTGRLQGWMFVSHASRKYDAVRMVASPPRHESWRPEPARAAGPSYSVLHLPFREFKLTDGPTIRVLMNPGYSMDLLLRTHQFIPEVW